MAKTTAHRNSASGFTLVEMVVVTALVITAAALTIPVTTRMVKDSKNDGAVLTLSTFLETARNRAVSQRRNIQLTFLLPNRMRLDRIEVPSGAVTQGDLLQLEGSVEFNKEPALTDTPDTFGNVLGALTAINYTGPGPVMFTSDGSLIDAAGDIVSATIFIGVDDDLLTARAVTISGMTGMLRTYKWRGTKWQ